MSAVNAAGSVSAASAASAVRDMVEDGSAGTDRPVCQYSRFPTSASPGSVRPRLLWQRFRNDDAGTGVVAALTIMFVFTAGALIWLSRDVDRAGQARSDATSIAFQASRSGAQQLQSNDLFGDAGVTVDPASARTAVTTTAGELLEKFGETGSVTSIIVEADRVTVTVSVTVAGRTVHGTGSARARQGVTGPGQ